MVFLQGNDSIQKVYSKDIIQNLHSIFYLNTHNDVTASKVHVMI